MSEAQRHLEVVAAILAAGVMQKEPVFGGTEANIDVIMRLYERLKKEVSKTAPRSLPPPP